MVFSSFCLYSSVIFSPHPPTHVIWTISPDRENRAGWLSDIRLAGNRRDSPLGPQTHAGLAEVRHFRVNYGSSLYDISALGQCSSFKVQISLRWLRVTMITCRRSAKLLKETHISMPINWIAVYWIIFYCLSRTSWAVSFLLRQQNSSSLASDLCSLSLSLFSFPSDLGGGRSGISEPQDPAGGGGVGPRSGETG